MKRLNEVQCWTFSSFYLSLQSSEPQRDLDDPVLGWPNRTPSADIFEPIWNGRGLFHVLLNSFPHVIWTLQLVVQLKEFAGFQSLHLSSFLSQKGIFLSIKRVLYVACWQMIQMSAAWKSHSVFQLKGNVTLLTSHPAVFLDISPSANNFPVFVSVWEASVTLQVTFTAEHFNYIFR